ncbi:MAG: hypothetical protein ACRC6O_13235 [Flavobacterium sp.]
MELALEILQLKILGSEISNPQDWVDNLNGCDFPFEQKTEIVKSRVNICVLNLRKEWTNKLEERGFTITEPTIPTTTPEPIFADYETQVNREDYETDEDYEQAVITQNQINNQNYQQAFNAVNLQNKELEDVYLEAKQVADLAFAELVFSQSDYKSQAQKQAKTAEQLLKEAKEQKIEQLEVAYTNAQLLKVVNGHTFLIPIAGDYFNQTISGQFNAAVGLGKAALIYPDINGQIVFEPKIPVAEWIKFYEPAKDIGVSNKLLKTYKEQEIKNCKDLATLNLIPLNIFPPIQEVILDI